MDDPRFAARGDGAARAEWINADAVIAEVTHQIEDGVNAAASEVGWRHWLDLQLLRLPIDFLWWASGLISRSRD